MPNRPKSKFVVSPVTPHDSNTSKSKGKRPSIPSAPLRRSKRKTEKPGEWWKSTKLPERRQIDLDADDYDEKTAVVVEENTERPTEPPSKEVVNEDADVLPPTDTIEDEREKESFEVQPEIEPAEVSTPVTRTTSSPKGPGECKTRSKPTETEQQASAVDFFTTPPVLRRLNGAGTTPPNAPRKLFKPPARFRTPLARNAPSPGPLPINKSTLDQIPARITLSTDLRPQQVGEASVSTALTLNGSIAGEIKIPGRCSTDLRLADEGDEFFSVISGVLECTMGHLVITVSAGDYIAVPKSSSYKFHNRLGVPARLIFFGSKSEEAPSYNDPPTYLRQQKQ